VNERAVAIELDALAVRIARLRPISHRNPHAFYEERSELAHEARTIAERLRGNGEARTCRGGG